MHIFVKNNYLRYGDYKVKCAVGKRGIGLKKKEGDLITPRGTFKIKALFYRKDRVKKLKTIILKKIITKKIGWCDDPSSAMYNKLIRYPFKFSSEKLHRSDNIYDIVLVLDFNMSPAKKNKGSAIFLHVARKRFSPTKGCVALKKIDLRKILKLINTKTKIKIS